MPVGGARLQRQAPNTRLHFGLSFSRAWLGVDDCHIPSITLFTCRTSLSWEHSVTLCLVLGASKSAPVCDQVCGGEILRSLALWYSWSGVNHSPRNFESPFSENSG